MRRAIAALALLLGGSVLAQESTSFKLSEHTFNAGGTPEDGADLISTSFRLTLSAIGDSVTPATLTSASFSLNGGLVGRYPPPGEVANLRDLRHGLRSEPMVDRRGTQRDAHVRPRPMQYV